MPPAIPPLVDAIPESRPNPDPTARTIDSLRREIGALRELIEARLDGGDKAIRLLQEATDRVPAHVEAAVRQLERLHDEKFVSIATRFQDRDVRTAQMALDAKTALDAALSAQEKAISKSEVAFTKQIDAAGAQNQTSFKGLDDKLNDVRDRLTAIENIKQGTKEGWGYLVGAIGAVGGVVGLLVVLLGRTA